MHWFHQIKSNLAELGTKRLARAITIGYVAVLATTFFAHFWLCDSHGALLPNDFTAIWTAGHLAVGGQATTAYNWGAFHIAQTKAIGHAFEAEYGWLYPPPFLFVAALLSNLPYLTAFFIWLAVTFPLYVFVIGRCSGEDAGRFAACAFPAVLTNIWPGQNGFLTAALIGATFLLMERRPVFSGICLGLLTYKPQFGLLFPFVLAIAGQWRVILAATLTALCMASVSVLAFGADTWLAFFRSIPVSANVFFEPGQVTWGKLQSVYGLVRMLGGEDRLAWSLQASATLSAGIGVAILWRSNVAFALKAAALATAVLLATPYVYIYDFPVLAVPIALLARDRKFDGPERAILGIACLLLLAYVCLQCPTGLAATFMVTLIISRRVRAQTHAVRNIALRYV